jgi:SIR2-like protein
MRLGPIDFHDELIAAQREERLVVFVGSGTSRGAPSNLPTFEELARTIADGIYDKSVDGPEDQFLGRKRREGIKVHARAKEIIGSSSSKPNQLHELIVQLSSSGGPLRIVTTNYDRHLSAVASKVCAPPPDIFCAPALPLGSSFKGIVYLHGSVDREEETMVLTDEDFGRAYLTDGWATRFLVGLFQSFTVLFVGYSHSDVIVSYLARGLPPQAKPRFALTDQNDPRWPLLGVVPLLYSPDNAHAGLAQGIAEWVELTKMGALDHEQRIRKIVAASPPLDPQEADYIKGALQDLAKTQFFTRYAVTEEWLDWCEQQDAFRWLFRPELGSVDTDRPITLIAAQLASWFARVFVLAMPERALKTIQRQGKQVQAILWNEIASCLMSHRPPAAQDVLAKWIAVLIPPPLGHFHTFLWGLLNKCQPQENEATPLVLFDHLTAPRLILTKPLLQLNGEGTVDWDVVIGGWDLPLPPTNASTAHELTQAWRNLFVPNLDVYARKLVPLLTSRLRQANLLFWSVGKAYKAWDPFSIRFQNMDHGEEVFWDFAPLVDAARDVLMWFLSKDSDGAANLIKDWISTEVPLLKRLAIYGLANDTHIDPDEKLELIVSADVIYALSPDREVTQLLNQEYAKASSAVRERLVAVLLQPPADLEEPSRSYLAYAMLEGLARFAPDCEILQRSISEILTQHPEFKKSTEERIPEEWFEPAGAATISQPAEVQALLEKKPDEHLEEILSYVGER